MNETAFRIAVIRGDGIGVDVTNAALAVAEAAGRRTGGCPSSKHLGHLSL
jgi:isocitrate/isopropylmalate dehydrogenase